MSAIDHHAQRLSDLLELLRILSTHGCGDGFCAINGPAKGMHTNGGCRCIEHIGEIALEIALEAERLNKACAGAVCLRRGDRGGRPMADRPPIRLLPSGVQVHICAHCGHVDAWGPTWSWYGSLEDLERGARVVKACCDECRQALVHERAPHA